MRAPLHVAPQPSRHGYRPVATEARGLLVTKRTVRISIRPHESIEVDEAEYLDLKRQKLLVDEDEPETTPEDSPTVAEPREHKDTPEQIAAARNSGPKRNQKEIN